MFGVNSERYTSSVSLHTDHVFKSSFYLCIVGVVEIPAFCQISESHSDHSIVFGHSEWLLPH